MYQLTIRHENGKALIDALRAHTGHATGNKAIWIAIRDFPAMHRRAVANLNRAVAAERELEELREALHRVARWLEAAEGP